MRLKSLVDYAAYLVLRFLMCVVQALPLSALEFVSRHLAWLAWHVLRIRRRVVEENLQIAFPEKSVVERNRIALSMWRHLFVMVGEIALAPRKLHRTNWREHSSVPEMRSIIRILLDERPKVVISGHLGNFELGGYLLALHGFPSYTIARTLDNIHLDRFVNRFRGATGQHMLPMHGSSGQIALLLERGGTLTLLGDQAAGASGVWTNFFGRPASTHKAMAIFSLSNSAPTAICAAIRQGKALNIQMKLASHVDPGEPGFSLDSVTAFTEWYTNTLEQLVRNTPEQYWWVHRRWKGKPKDRRARRKNQTLAA